MFDYATDLREELLIALSGKDPAIDGFKKLTGHMAQVLSQKDRAGLIDLPAAVQSHNMRLARAFAQLRNQEPDLGTRQFCLEDLVRWMSMSHYFDITAMGRRMHLANPGRSPEEALHELSAAAGGLLESGTIGKGYAPDTDLGRSAWDGMNYKLHLEGWRFILRAPHSGPLRLGSIMEPLREAPVPQIREVEMRFPTGKLLIASDAIIPALAEEHVKMRRAAEFKGLKGDLAVTDEILFATAMIALPIYARSVTPLADGGEFSLIHRRAADDEDEDEDEHQSILLNYMHLFVADEHACLEAMRENWNDKDEVLAMRLAAARKTSSLSVSEVEIDPGRYLLTLPANHHRALPKDHSCLGSEHHVLLNLKKIETE